MRSIPGYKGYFATEDGKIIGRSGKVLRSCPDKDGYLRVPIFIGKENLICFKTKKKLRGIHQLVCLAFHGEPVLGFTEVRHIDGNNQNNSASNLCWGNRQQNISDRDTHGKAPRGERHGMAKLNEKQVLEIRKLSSGGWSNTDIMQKFNISNTAVYSIVNRITWRYLLDC